MTSGMHRSRDPNSRQAVTAVHIYPVPEGSKLKRAASAKPGLEYLSLDRPSHFSGHFPLHLPQDTMAGSHPRDLYQIKVPPKVIQMEGIVRDLRRDDGQARNRYDLFRNSAHVTRRDLKLIICPDAWISIIAAKEETDLDYFTVTSQKAATV